VTQRHDRAYARFVLATGIPFRRNDYDDLTIGERTAFTEVSQELAREARQ
jgi:hypothetical protein